MPTIRMPLAAGPELDAKVHELVFGPDIVNVPVDDVHQYPYSRRINFAWDLVIELRNLGWLVRVQEMPEGFPYHVADDLPDRIDLRVIALVGRPGELHRTEGKGYANAAPLAICRAIVDTAERPGFKGFRNAES